MYDSFGDTWSGTTVSVLVEGNHVITDAEGPAGSMSALSVSIAGERDSMWLCLVRCWILVCVCSLVRERVIEVQHCQVDDFRCGQLTRDRIVCLHSCIFVVFSVCV